MSDKANKLEEQFTTLGSTAVLKCSDHARYHVKFSSGEEPFIGKVILKLKFYHNQEFITHDTFTADIIEPYLYPGDFFIQAEVIEHQNGLGTVTIMIDGQIPNQE